MNITWTLEGIVQHKENTILTLMLFQTFKIFVYLWNTNEDIFNKTWEISVPVRQNFDASKSS